MLEEEAIEVVKQIDLMVDYKEVVHFVLNYVHQNKHLLYCAYDSMGRDEMKRFFYSDFIGIVNGFVNRTEEKLGIQVDSEFKKFLAHFYTEGLAGLLIDEFKDKENHNPDTAVKYISLIMNASLPEVLKRSVEVKSEN